MIGFIYLCGVFLLIFGIVLFFQCNMGDLYDLYSLISVFFTVLVVVLFMLFLFAFVYATGGGLSGNL